MNTVVILIRMRFLNFKGIRNKTIEFNGVDTDILGRNGTCKTSVYDGFKWVLFEKNADDKSDFGIKTTNPDGSVIERIPHEVEIWLWVNGEEVILRKEFTEKWVTPRGKTEDEFKGHVVERFYNNVPVTQTDFDAKVRELLPEKTFKLITDPHFFNHPQEKVFSWKERREMLYKMAGGVDEAELRAKDSRYDKLLTIFEKKGEDGYKAEIAANKTRLKKELVTIKPKIEENIRNMPPVIDWDIIQTELTDKQSEYVSIQTKLENVVKAEKETNEKILKLTAEKREIEIKKIKVESDIEFEAKKNEMFYSNKIKECQYEIQTADRKIGDLTMEIDAKERRYNELEDERKALLDSWYAERKKEISKDELEAIETDKCPTCGHPTEDDKKLEMQANLKKTFNANKVKALNKIETEGADLKKNQELIKELIGKLKSNLNESRQMLINAKERLADFTTKKNECQSENVLSDLLLKNTEIPSLQQAIEAKDLEIAAIKEPADNSELKASQKELYDEIKSLESKLRDKEDRQKLVDRNIELEAQEKALAQKIADYQNVEDVIMSLNRDKAEMIEDRVNNLFHHARFKMFHKQVDGNLVETCVTMYKGNVWSDLSTGEKVLVGIDIINAISKFLEVSAPTFMDNAESVTEPFNCINQLIRLFADPNVSGEFRVVNK